jgi:hypothetical protein
MLGQFAGVVVASVALAACMGQSRPARAQEAASDMNTHIRFGRVELAGEKVDTSYRNKFVERRRQWGQGIRLGDTEISAIRMVGEDRAETNVSVSWYRVDEGELHSTKIKQIWKDFKGDWRLIEEERVDGDVGLLGEPVPERVRSKEAPKNAQFPTIRLGTNAPAAPAVESGAAEGPEGQ